MKGADRIRYTEAQNQIIKGIIMATVVPQSPATILEKIMADADLDVLGRDDFMLCNGTLRRELAFFGKEFTDAEWYSGQLKLVETHTYFIGAARALRDRSRRRPKHMQRNGEGVILNVASTLGLVGGQACAAYYASRAEDLLQAVLRQGPGRSCAGERAASLF